jgi:hypothetical protein
MGVLAAACDSWSLTRPAGSSTVPCRLSSPQQKALEGAAELQGFSFVPALLHYLWVCAVSQSVSLVVRVRV